MIVLRDFESVDDRLLIEGEFDCRGDEVDAGDCDDNVPEGEGGRVDGLKGEPGKDDYSARGHPANEKHKLGGSLSSDQFTSANPTAG